jgi:hypothetical protein
VRVINKNTRKAIERRVQLDSHMIVVSFFKELRVHRVFLLLSLESTINNYQNKIYRSKSSPEVK